MGVYKMRCVINVFVPGIMLAISVGALAQGTTYKVGRTPTQEEIQAWDISVSPEGKGLPPGNGTATEGAKIYAQKCAKCHGPTGEQAYGGFTGPGGSIGGFLRRTGPNNTPRPPWPYAPNIWAFIYKAMPRFEEGSLSANDTYALTALVLYWSGLIKATDVMDAETLPKVQMPNRDGYIPAHPSYQWYHACNPNLLRCVDSLTTR
jgi:mono/diheme cytochrome c family protein